MVSEAVSSSIERATFLLVKLSCSSKGSHFQELSLVTQNLIVKSTSVYCKGFSEEFIKNWEALERFIILFFFFKQITNANFTSTIEQLHGFKRNLNPLRKKGMEKCGTWAPSTALPTSHYASHSTEQMKSYCYWILSPIILLTLLPPPGIPSASLPSLCNRKHQILWKFCACALTQWICF